MTAVMVGTKEVRTVEGTKVTIGSEDIKLLKNIAKVHKKGSVDILNSFLFEVRGSGEIIVKYGSSDMSIVTTLQSEYTEMKDQNKFTLPIDIIKKITRIKKGETFTFEILEQLNVKMNRNGIKKNIHVMDTEEFPIINGLNAEFIKIPLNKDSLTYDDILEFEKAALSTSTLETRPVLTTICFRNGKMITTDSHRLYCADSPLDHINYDINLLASSVKAYKTIFNKGDKLEMSLGDRELKMTNGKTTIYSRHMNDSKYPITDNMIPKYFKAEFSLCDVSKLKDFLEDTGKGVANLRVGSYGYAELNSIRPDESKTEVLLDVVDPKLNDETDFRISFNAKNVLDVLKQFDDRPIKLKYTGALNPFVIEPVEKINGEFALLSPVRTY